MVREVRRYIYIMTSRGGVLYTGLTGDLRRRVYQHKTGSLPGFTRQYAVTRLVHYEWTDHIRAALEREREIKSWSRAKKVRLIDSQNPGWLDLAIDWFPDLSGQDPSLRSG